MSCVQNVCVEPILISLNPILTEFVMLFVPDCFDDRLLNNDDRYGIVGRMKGRL